MQGCQVSGALEGGGWEPSPHGAAERAVPAVGEACIRAGHAARETVSHIHLLLLTWPICLAVGVGSLEPR